MAAPHLTPAFNGWFRSNYPTVVFEPGWLEGCVEYILNNDPAASTMQGLIKAVEVQLLSSDLSTSVLPSASNAAAFSTIYPARDKAVLFCGGARKAGVLVQVQSVEDVAHSAGSLKDIMGEKREAARIAAKGGGGGGGDGGGEEGGGRIMDLDDDDGEEEQEEAKEQEDDELKKKVLKGNKKPTYPRGSGKFLLSDGQNEVWAFELQRIPGLGLEEIELGTKLLIHDVPSVNGILMLSPKNTVVKGHQVEELERDKEWSLENSLRARLQMDPLPQPQPPHPANNPAVNAIDLAHDDDLDMKPRPASPLQRALANNPAIPPPPAASSSRSAPKPPPSSANIASHSQSKPTPRAKRPPQPSSEEYYGDDLDMEAFAEAEMRNDHAVEEEEWAAMVEAEAEAEAVARRRRPPATPTAPSASSSGAAKVKKPPSSGSGGAVGSSSASGSRTGLTGRVDMIDLLDDSDEEEGAGKDEAEEVKPARKKVKQEAASQGSRIARTVGAGPKKGMQVLEIDSD